MRSGSLTFCLPLLVFAACAGVPPIEDEAPDWLDVPIQSTEVLLAFRGTAVADSVKAAREASFQNLADQVIEAMQLGDSGWWEKSGSEKVNDFREELIKSLHRPQRDSLPGMTVLDSVGWRESDEQVGYAVDITWNDADFRFLTDELLVFVYTESVTLLAQEHRARDAESEGNYYEAAFLWSKAAFIAMENENEIAFRRLLDQISRVLNLLKFKVVEAPDFVVLGTRSTDPVTFQVVSEDSPVKNAEFVIQYPRFHRDGGSNIGTARLFSDEQGLVTFFPPEPAFPGSQKVGIAPSAVPFLELAPADSQNFLDFVDQLENPKAWAEYEALSHTREIPTGILVLETDLADNILEFQSTSRGILETLSSDGFNVSLLNLDPGEVMIRSEKALLRDLKADPQFNDVYDRVIFGKVSLENFSQEGETFVVQVSGTITLADIQRQVPIYRETLSKSSRAADSQQAISAAFRQLGRDFARIMMEQTDLR